MRLYSWNVNGLRACLGKGFLDFFQQADADLFALQETKLQPGQVELELPGYQQYWNSAVKKGYSGTAVFSRLEPLSVAYDFPGGQDGEGRAITLELPEFYFVTVYSPNVQRELTRLEFRMGWQDALAAYLKELDRGSECGPSGNRPKESQVQPGQRGLYRSGAAEARRTFGRGLCGYLPGSVPGSDRRVHLVELHVPRAAEQRRVEN